MTFVDGGATADDVFDVADRIFVDVEKQPLPFLRLFAKHLSDEEGNTLVLDCEDTASLVDRESEKPSPDPGAELWVGQSRSLEHAPKRLGEERKLRENGRLES